MYVCRTFESTVTKVGPPLGEGECDMMPHPSLFAEPSIPRARRGRARDVRQSMNENTYMVCEVVIVSWLGLRNWDGTNRKNREVNEYNDY